MDSFELNVQKLLALFLELNTTTSLTMVVMYTANEYINPLLNIQQESSIFALNTI